MERVGRKTAGTGKERNRRLLMMHNRVLVAVFQKYDDIATLRACMRKRRRKEAPESSAGQEPESIE